MTYLIQELLELREEQILNERVDNMLDRLKTHFSNVNISDPAKIFSKEDLQILSYQLAGLNFILDQKDFSKSVPELSDKKIVLMLFNELDEPKERKLFNDRTQTADEFLSFIGKKYDSSTSKQLLKNFEELKKMKNISVNSGAIVSFISKIEVKLQKLLRTVK